MAECYMITRPRNKERESVQEVKILQFMLDNDVHKFIVAKETGLNGYEHWQIRIKIRNLEPDEKKEFKFFKEGFGQSCHVEECSETWEYEKKDGDYWDEGDFNLSRIERLMCRKGELKKWQKDYLKLVRTQDVRTIDVCYDINGNNGKSWLSNHLVETGQAHYVPPYCTTIERMVQTVATLYLKEWRDILVIDIPRSYTWSAEICTAIESIKDGNIMETRFHPVPINVRGIKIIVMCNDEPPKYKWVGRGKNKVKKPTLSEDRWRISTLQEQVLRAPKT